MMHFLSFFRRKTSGTIAKDRLKILLISDRTNCSTETMEMIKNDIIAVISKYMKIDAESTEIQITQSKGRGNFTPSLSANIPILDLKKN
ncbi:MAG: cell division topological specificity factor MinE [Lachnospiraceae bacterium]|nr:cell division topological specificity factor MinE [Lachnospiraceae bacterium]